MIVVMVLIMEFEDAIAQARNGHSTVHALLGNGFSIAYDPAAFSYGRLLDAADFSALSVDAREVFAVFGITDFERVIKALRDAAILVPMYGGSEELAAALGNDAERLKEALAQVLAANHPDAVFQVDQDEYRSARQFLHHFNSIYTINYDLLTYWTLIQDDLPPPQTASDGFRNSEQNPDADWVAWHATDGPSSQRLYYLHGALHLFDGGTELRKITWIRTGRPLLDQIREALADDLYPLVITEGRSEEKLDQILHSAYLSRALRSFANIKGALFVYGMSLSANDDHILERIERGKLDALYVGIYGDPTSPGNVQIIARADEIAARRAEASPRFPLVVRYFDAASANVWR